MPGCAGCGEELEARFRFCPWCGLVQRRKIVEFFWPHANSPGRALRVTRYVGDEQHVRFSVWEDGVARAAVSIREDEAERLADFLRETGVPTTRPSSPRAAGSTGPQAARRRPGARP